MMNKRKIAFATFTSLLAIISTYIMSSAGKPFLPLNAQDGNYVLLLDENNNSVTDIISRGNALTANSNSVAFEFESLSSHDGYWGRLDSNGYFVNRDEIRGIRGLICEFEGTLSIDLKYEPIQDYVRVDLPLTSNEHFDFGIESPDYIRFTTSSGALISSITYTYSCDSVLPNAYNKQFIVDGNASDTSDGLEMEIDVTNKDTSYVRYLKDVDVSYGDSYKIVNNDFSLTATKDSYRLDNAALLAGQYTIEEEGVINFAYNGAYTFEYCLPTPTNSYDRSWVGLKDLPKVLYSENHLDLYGSDNKVEYLFDNNENTYFFENGNALSGSYIIIDLVKITHVDYLEIIYSWTHSSAAHYPHISYSTTGIDNEDFTLVKTVTGDQKVNGVVNLGFDARFIKLSNDYSEALAWWVSIAEIYINESPSNDALITFNGFISSDGNGGIYQGSISNILDGNRDTYCWFNEFPQEGAYILIDFKQTIENINYINIYFKDLYGDSNPSYLPVVQYSDGINGFITLTDNNDVNDLVINLENPINIRYLKLTHQSVGRYDKWVSIADIVLDTRASVITSDFAVGGIYQGSVEDMFDGNKSTFAWFNDYPLNGGYILVDYVATQIDVTTLSINFFDGTPGQNCYLPVISYSLDGIEFITIEDNNSSNVFVHSFDTPVSFRYLKIANTYDETRDETYHYDVWVGISEIELNKPVHISVDHNIGGIYSGNLDNMFDGNDDTFVWFAGVMGSDTYLSVSYSHIIETSRLRILFKDGNGTSCFGTQIEVKTHLEDDWQVLVSNNLSNEIIIEESLSFKYFRITSPEGNGGLWLSVASIDFE